MNISIVTPTYNRIDLISRSVDSSLGLIRDGYAKELVIVDDSSLDDTVCFLRNKYSREIDDGLVKLVALHENQGVTGAKNEGAKVASGEWIVFMDSDDFFLPGSGSLICDELVRSLNFDIVFFRCIDDKTGDVIGGDLRECEIDLRFILNYGTPGECLPVVKRAIFISHLYPKNLRGCESLSYIELLRDGSRAKVSKHAVRGYRSVGEDRLSTRVNVFKRSKQMFLYNRELLKYYRWMAPRTVLFVFVKIIAYGVFCFFKNISPRRWFL